MKKLSLALLLLLITSAALVAQEDSLLSRLQAETRGLAEAAEAALVVATVENKNALPGAGAGGAVRADGPWVVNRNGQLEFVNRQGQLVQRWVGGGWRGGAATGVLVGSPAKVVLPYEALGRAATVTVRLPDGKTHQATRQGGDADLGVAVYQLPKDVAQTLRGLTPESDWGKLKRGTLAVEAGAKASGLLGLTMVSGVDERAGLLSVDKRTTGGALVGTGRTLLGLQTPGGWTTSNCAGCHAGSNANGLFVADATRKAAGAALTNRNRAAPTAYLNSFRSGMYGHVAAVAGTATVGIIPGPVIARVVKDIEEHGSVRHGYLGVVLGDARGKGKEAGVAITAVLDGSPAGQAGLKVNERIRSVGGLKCTNPATISRALALRKPGDEIELTLAPDDRKVKVTLGDRVQAQKHLTGPEQLGLTCAEPGPELRRFLGLGENFKGVVVMDVAERSAAERAGLRAGDVIMQGGGGGVADLEELRAAIAGAKDYINFVGTRDKGARRFSVRVKIPAGKGTTR